MKHYYISHQDDETKRENIKLYTTIRDKGKFLYSDWRGDYLVATYVYEKKTYELWDNMELGIMSEVVELEGK